MIDTKLYLYNTMAQKKEEFLPIEPGKVKMYSCGPTVYNLFHIGNARPFILFDTLRRYLEYKGYEVTFVQNFTDIDDKMIRKANELGITVKELADRYIAEYKTDAEGLGIRPATVHPRATENMDAIIALIQRLVDSGHAYEVNGDVYYSTKSFPEYGKLSHQPLEDLESGARIEVNEDKRDPMDFALWKSQKPGEPAWDSPWGPGRPGWHIECSAMANTYLGKTIDIHSGGRDLIFPHHENEIAQSEAANGCRFANYWLHNGHINVDNRKMSKSLGNFFTVRDVAKEFDYEVIRFFMLSSHYRSPINFSKELMEAAKAGLERMYNCLSSMEFFLENAPEREPNPAETAFLQEAADYRTKFIRAMDDDLNTADAVSVIFELVAAANKAITAESGTAKSVIAGTVSLIRELGGVLGLLDRRQDDGKISQELDALLEKRAQARAEKDWAASDALRDRIRELGYAVKDTPQGQQLTRL